MPNCPRCWFQLLTIVTMVKAVIARLIFGVHSFIAIWRVTDVKGPVYWCLALALMVLTAEGVLTIWKKKGAEWKWFSPVVFFYLCSVVPAIWFLELDLLAKRLHNKELAESGKLFTQNASKSAQSQTSSEGLSMIKGVGIYIPIQMTADDWAKVLEQLLLLFLIVGRWLLPKGDITRDQLSQLLLVNIGMAADIIELFEAFREDQVRYNWILTVIILSLWTGSLSQFTLVVTATKARKPRVAIASKKSDLGTCFCCETEIWAIMTSIALQDGPFLVLRLLLILRYEVVSYMNVFFTCKNTLVMLLQIYRIVVVLMERGKHKNENDDKSRDDTEIMTLSRSESNLKNRSNRHLNAALHKSKSYAGLQKSNSIHEMNKHSKSSRSYPAITAAFTEYSDELYPRPTLRPKYPKELQLIPARTQSVDIATSDSESPHTSPEKNSLQSFQRGTPKDDFQVDIPRKVFLRRGSSTDSNPTHSFDNETLPRLHTDFNHANCILNMNDTRPHPVTDSLLSSIKELKHDSLNGSLENSPFKRQPSIYDNDDTLPLAANDELIGISVMDSSV